MKPTLLILAWGMWSRYGWLKQIDWFWPHWQAILEYSIYDAIRAGFRKVVIVLRKDFQEQFDAKFANTFQWKIEVQYVYQTFDLARYGYGDGSQAVGPARGSCAGSLICYCLGITSVDPVKEGLLFSRFLSEARGGRSLVLEFKNVDPLPPEEMIK